MFESLSQPLLLSWKKKSCTHCWIPCLLVHRLLTAPVWVTFENQLLYIAEGFEPFQLRWGRILWRIIFRAWGEGRNDRDKSSHLHLSLGRGLRHGSHFSAR